MSGSMVMDTINFPSNKSLRVVTSLISRITGIFEVIAHGFNEGTHSQSQISGTRALSRSLPN